MFKYLDLPKIPDHLIDIIRQEVKNYHDETVLKDFNKMHINENIATQIDKEYGESVEGLGVPFDTAYKYGNGLATFTMIKLDGPVLEWIKENISDKINGLHIQVIDGKFVFPHIDMLRNRVWNYTIDSADAITCFYKAKPEYEHLKLVPRTYVPYDRVELVKEYKILEHKWHELDVSLIHGVEKINGVRLALSISFVD
jgi:hypothetical protein